MINTQKKEIAIVFFIAALCISAMLIFKRIQPSGIGEAVISVDGNEVFRRSLEEEGQFTVNGINNMTFEINNGGVRVVSSDCPDKICIKSGFVCTEGSSAVCLPNKVIVTVED